MYLAKISISILTKSPGTRFRSTVCERVYGITLTENSVGQQLTTVRLIPSTATNPIKMKLDDMKILYVHSISGKLFL